MKYLGNPMIRIRGGRRLVLREGLALALVIMRKGMEERVAVQEWVDQDQDQGNIKINRRLVRAEGTAMVIIHKGMEDRVMVQESVHQDQDQGNIKIKINRNPCLHTIIYNHIKRKRSGKHREEGTSF